MTEEIEIVHHNPLTDSQKLALLNEGLPDGQFYNMRIMGKREFVETYGTAEECAAFKARGEA